MKYLVYTFLLTLSVSQVLAQGTLVDKKGTAHFFSEAPLEDIEAKNEAVIGAINLEKGVVAVSMFMKDFRFDKSLMEEHFNENYVESDKYPKSTFKGVIKNFNDLDFSKTGTIEAEAEGEIEIHGVSQPHTAKVTFNVTPENIEALTEFEIAIADFDIKIPKLVIKNIAEIVEVKSTFNFNRTE